MSRAHIDYTAPRGAGRTFDGLNPDEPVEGYYRIWPAGGLASGIRIWFGPPLDPVTGEELDRSWRWQAHENGRYVELERVWPKAGKDPIDKAEYDYLTARVEHARKAAPQSPAANPRRKVDLLTAPLPF